MYDGGFEDFSVTGSFHMEREVNYKNNPLLEAEKRCNMAYLLLKNPRMIDVIQQKKAYFFHGTNANALPGILKYGINSVNKSKECDIPVTTGEKWSRIEGKRDFVSLTDCIDVALRYSNISPNNAETTNTLLNFGVIIGTSLEDMKDIRVSGIRSDTPEIGVHGNLPVGHVKFLAVPSDKVEFVKKMIGEKEIEVVAMEMKENPFICNSIYEKLNILEQIEPNQKTPKQNFPTYFKDDIKPVVSSRKTSEIRKIFEMLKSRLHKKDKDKDEDTSRRK